MTPVLLVYPFFRPFPDLTIFRQPPLGVSYVAASLREAGHPVQLLDCTFLTRREALVRAREARARVVGIYSMVSMMDDSVLLARALRGSCELLLAGGPLPTCSPEAFLGDFDVVVLDPPVRKGLFGTQGTPGFEGAIAVLALAAAFAAVMAGRRRK